MSRAAHFCVGLAGLWAAMLGGCATAPTADEFRARMDRAVSRFSDQPVALALVRLGSEDRRTRANGLLTYVWRGERIVDTQRFNTVTANGHIGLVSMLGNANYARYAPAADICELQFDVGPDGRVRIGRWSGDVVGCQGYAEALER